MKKGFTKLCIFLTVSYFSLLFSHFLQASWWKWWIYRITITKLNCVPFTKKTESASLAKNVATLTAKMSSENLMTQFHFNPVMENKMEWTAFKKESILNSMIKTKFRIRRHNNQNSELSWSTKIDKVVIWCWKQIVFCKQVNKTELTTLSNSF